MLLPAPPSLLQPVLSPFSPICHPPAPALRPFPPPCGHPATDTPPPRLPLRPRAGGPSTTPTVGAAGIRGLRVPRGARPPGDGQPGAAAAALQRGHALGGHRGAALRGPGQARAAAQEVPQDRGHVSAAGRRRGWWCGAGCRRALATPRHSLTPPPIPRSCKQNQDLLSFYAVVMGLDNAAVSRLRLTWEVMTRLPFPLLPPVLARLGRGVHPGVHPGGCSGPVGSLCAERREAPSSGRSSPRAGTQLG